MPKVVDHDARRREIAAALWRVVRRDGLHTASVRTVAAEAGWSPSATRHYFASQDDLLGFALDLVDERVRARLDALRSTGDVVSDVRAALCEVLPLDRERREDNEVWLSLSARAQTDAGLRSRRARAYDDLHGLAHSAILTLREAGLLRPGADATAETDRLHALLDGLAVHAATRPRAMTPARMQAALDVHLGDMVGG